MLKTFVFQYFVSRGEAIIAGEAVCKPCFELGALNYVRSAVNINGKGVNPVVRTKASRCLRRNYITAFAGTSAAEQPICFSDNKK